MGDINFRTMKNRRNFLGNSALTIFGIAGGFHSNKIVGSGKYDSMIDIAMIDPIHARFPSQSLDVVREVVGAAHANFDKLKELVTARPELAKATYDWGFGDWESAIGASSHMGRKDMVEFLMSHGARPNIFTWAMLGKLDTVKTIIESSPGIQGLPGPHGITLMSHAKMRLRRKNVEGLEKQEQEALVAYLESIGDADIGATSLEITKEEQAVYFGKYKFGDGEDEYFKVDLNSRGLLFIARGEDFGRSLLRNGEHVFAPGGAPSVRVHFKVLNGHAESLSIHDPDLVLKAMRVT